MTLLDALQKETEGEQVFAYPSHLHGFNAGRNILINNVGAAIVVVGMWCFVVSGLSKKGEM